MMMYESLARRLLSLENPAETAQGLDHVPVQTRSFHHGERTADLGTLGDDSGQIVLWPNQDALDSGDRIEWVLSAGVHARASSCSVPTSGTGNSDDGCAGGVGGRQGAIYVYAGKPGRFYVQLYEVAGSGNQRHRGELLGWQILSVPQFVHVTTDQTFRDRVDAVASSLTGNAEAKRTAFLEKVQRIAAHVLRPANVRVIYDDLGGSLPAQFDENASETRNGLVTGVQDPESFPGCASDHLVELTLAGTDGNVTVNDYGQELSDGSPTGRIAVDADLAPVGGSATAGDVKAHLSSLTDAETKLERAARWLGVALARGVLTAIGIEENEELDGVDADQTDLYERALFEGDIMNASPANPVRDLLGVDTDSSDDLVDEYVSEFGVTADDSGVLTVLDRTTPYDVLVGAVGTNPDDESAPDGTLDQIEDELPLGPAYGGFALRAGDEDADGGSNATYGGAERTNSNVLPSSDEPGYVRLLQDDLRLLGIELAPPASDSTGSGRMGGPGSKERDNSSTLHTEWALREFQIALSYPKAALYQFANEEVYGANLAAIPNPTRVTSGSGDDLNMEPAKRVVTGVVDSMTGYRLRRWRFRRARYPIVIEARTSGDYSKIVTYDTDNDGTADERLDNIWDSEAVESTSPRVFVRDFSGHVDVEPDEEVEPGLKLHTLGDKGFFHSVEGPHMTGSNHGEVPLVPSNFHASADDLTDLSSDELAVYKAVSAATYQESTGYFDVVNCYDYQALSHPLCHYVFGLGYHAEEPGEWAGFLAALHHDMPDTYMRYYGSRGVWPSAMYGKASNGKRVGEYTWRGSGKHEGVVYVLHRKVADDGQVDGDLAIRGMTGTNDTKVSESDRRRYAQWFRTWHWMYRVVASIRGDQELRRFIYQFTVRRIVDIDDAYGMAESEFAVAMALRLHVRAPGVAKGMLNAASGKSNEDDRIEAMLKDTSYSKATGEVTFKVKNGNVSVPKGTAVEGTDDGDTYGFTTDSQVTPSSSTTSPTTVTAEITADDYGEAYNLDAGTVTDLPSPPADVIEVTSATKTTGGAKRYREEAEQTVEWPGGPVPGIDSSQLSDLGSQHTYKTGVAGVGDVTTRLSTDPNDFPVMSTVKNIATPLPSLPNTFDDSKMDRPWEWVTKD